MNVLEFAPEEQIHTTFGELLIHDVFIFEGNTQRYYKITDETRLYGEDES